MSPFLLNPGEYLQPFKVLLLLMTLLTSFVIHEVERSHEQPDLNLLDVVVLLEKKNTRGSACFSSGKIRVKSPSCKKRVSVS
jgi:hypothetical protein